MRLTVHAKPGSRHESVTAQRSPEGSDGIVLVVRVRARAVEGAANKAVVAAVAAALGLRRSAVTVTVGQRSRTKVLDIDADDDVIKVAVDALTEQPDD